MNQPPSEMRCTRCGETSSGRYCIGCGAPLRDVSCGTCGTPAVPGSKFCANCGAALSVGATAGLPAPAAARRPDHTARLVIGAAMLTLIAFIAGDLTGRGSGGAAPSTDQSGGAPLMGSAPAPDISQLSPEERASRLFNRVMLYAEQNKLDSARFFAPMAIQSYEMIGPLDLHARYDVGVIYAAIGDGASARAQADTILAAKPRHLLGLVLAMRAAALAGDNAARAKFAQRLVDAAAAERASGLKEYDEHVRDIDEALKQAKAR